MADLVHHLPEGHPHVPGAQNSDRIAYLSWSNSPISAKLEGGQFRHAADDNWNASWTSPHLTYLSWTGEKRQVRMDGSQFVHLDENGAEIDRSPIINYKSHSGANWTMGRGHISITTPGVVRLGLDLACDKTTELGEDEIYVLVGARWSDGTKQQRRLPSDSGHWSMNDDQEDDNHIVRNIELWEGSVPLGQSVELGIAIMEEDGGSAKPYVDLLSYALQQSQDATAVAIGKALKKIAEHIDLYDSDDYPGSFCITLRNSGGGITATFRPAERVASEISNIHGPNTHEFRLNGDGSDYVAWLSLV